MKKITFLLSFVALILFNQSSYSQTLVFEDFETAIGTAPSSGYVVREATFPGAATSANVVEFNLNNSDPNFAISADYFGRVQLSELNNANPAYNITNIQGNRFFGIADADQSGNPNGNTDSLSLNWFNIDVSSVSTMNASAFFAENQATPSLWDADHSVRFEYSTDNILWASFFAIESAGTSNTSAKIDSAPFDGTGDGATLTDVLTKYTSIDVDISTMNTISVRIVMDNFSSGQENVLFDNFTLEGSTPAITPPAIPTATFAPGTICSGNSSLLSIFGDKNDATQWSVYTGSCGGTFVGSTPGSTIIVTPSPSPSLGTQYFIRGEGGGVVPGACRTVTVPVTPREDASFSYSAASYLTSDSDPTPTISGVGSGDFTRSPAGLIINGSTGEIDLSASTPNTYTVNYTTPGLCAGDESQSVTIIGDPEVTLTASLNSANENAGSITLTATADVPPSSNLMVNLSYSGTAIGGTDYTQVSSITIPSGMTTGTATINFTGDTTVEADETIIVDITSLTGVTATEGSPNQQTLTITNDDSATVTIANVAVNENSGTATISLSVDNAVDGGFDVGLSTADNTAMVADGDYAQVNSAIRTFAGTASETRTLDVVIGVDTKVEADEIIDIAMNNLVPTTVDSGDIDITDTATLTINNDDSATVTIANVSGNEDDGAITVTVQLDNAVDGGFDVDVSTADGTATTADSDYGSVTSQTLTFSGTAAEQETFTVTPTADVNSESDETVSISMSNKSPASVASANIDITDGATLTILNDDSISASINDPSVSEGDAGSATLTFTVTLDSGAPAGGATVDFATSDGTSSSASDYTSTSGTVSFSVGETSKTIDVTVSGDEVVEVDVIIIDIASLTGVTATEGSPNQQILTITNDDSATVTIANVSVNENSGIATITLTLDNAIDGGFDVDVSTSDNTATTADGDYAAVTNATQTFAGTASETEIFTITLGGDTKVEVDEIVDIAMSNLSPATVASGDINITDTAQLTITNDDSASVTIANVTVNEDNGIATVTLTLDNAVDGGFDVGLSTADNTAMVADGDYAQVNSAIRTFAGTASETRTLDVVTGVDTKVEADEIIDIAMNNLVPTTVDSGDIDITDTATVTITNDDSATVTIANVSVNENDGTATITLTLDSAVDGGFDVDVSTADNTATTADGDYTAVTNATETFAGTAFETQTFTITLGGDTKVEADELVDIVMSNVLSATVDSGDINITDAAQLTITNDDSASVTIANVAVNENAGTATITLTLDNAVDGGFDLDVSTADGTATTADSDYTAVTSATETFAGTAAETEIFTVTLGGDTKVESDETITLSMSGLSPATVASGDIDITDGATLTLNNDDRATLTIANVNGNEDDGAITVTVTLDNAVDGGLDVDVSTADGTAMTTDSDYTAITNQTLTFAGTAAESETFTITPTADTNSESDETVIIGMSNKIPSTVSSSDVDITDGATVTILNDDDISASVNDPNIAEGASGTSTLTYTVTLDNPAPAGGATINYATSDGSAEAGTDYSATSGTLNFSTGQTSQTIDVTVAGDAMVELDETLTVTLSNPTGTDVVIGDATGSGTITNDDMTVVTIANVSASENAGTQIITATLSNPVQGGFAFDVFTTDGTATTADSDYSSTAGSTLTFVGTAGETQTLNLQGLGDTKVEADETFTMSMTNVGFTSVNPANIDITDVATYTILNDDTATVTISNVEVNESVGGTLLTLTLDNEVDGGFSVNVNTVDGTATAAGVDYAAIVGQLESFIGNAGEIRNVTIAIGENSIAEPTEVFTLSMSDLTPTSAAVSDIDITSTGTITIIDNDSASLAIDNISRQENADGASTDFTFTVTLTGNVQSAFTIDYATSNITAIGDDYTAANGTLNFAGTNGETQTLTVSVTGDETVEQDESFAVILSNLQAGGVPITLPPQAFGTIENDDNAPVVTVGQFFSIDENSANTSSVGTVIATDADAGTTFGDWTITNGNISVDGDADVPFAINTITGEITVNDSSDLDFESGTTSFTLSLTVGDGTNTSVAETLTINVNDVDDTGTVTIDDISANEDDGSITVTATLDNPIQGGFTVDVNTADGTATVTDADYTAVTSETLSFTGNAGETKTFVINPTDDNKVEVNETITVSMNNIGSALPGTSINISDTATVTINNDDTTVVTIADVSANENSKAQSITATLSNPVQGGFSLDVFTTDGTATVADNDYSATDGSILTFIGNAGETQSLNIGVIGDSIVEDDENFIVSMQNISVTSVSSSDIDITDTAIYTILNDDFTIGGEVVGLEKGNSLVLQNNGGDDLEVSANSTFTFLTSLTFNDNYSVTVLQDPTSPVQTCTVTMGEGMISTTNVTDVLVSCTTDQFFIGGTLSGLSTGNSVTLDLNDNKEQLPLNTNGGFAFAMALNDLSEYTISVAESPQSPSQTCEITNATGQINAEDVDNVVVNCSTDSFFIGGRVTGLAEGYSLRLENNSSDQIIQSTNGTFVFETPLLDLSSYDVGFEILPANTSRDCNIENESGDLAGDDIDDITIRCNFFNDLIFYNGFELNNSENR